ncbi:MAG: sucrose-6-phosphate hydrolase [Herbinix sp.]|jgi:beta-fructofuranosidase|nr:sucrose-6-phosphate hydrolase [Herbinix sp.]
MNVKNENTINEAFKISEELIRARNYEVDQQKGISAVCRPVFHFSSPVGWLNDPNGFSVYQREYHLFYQYHPYSTQWGPMHWGHCKSIDFIRWEQLPAALAPDSEFDRIGCFSGSAVQEEGNHILMYTGVAEKMNEDGTSTVIQEQCIAVGNGVNYVKTENNPVITADMLPYGSSFFDFRDPKIWKEDGIFYAIIGNRNEDGSGQLAVFQSENALEWRFMNIIDKNNNEYGRMWECPDFFTLGEKQIIILSPQEMKAKDFEYHNGNGTMCFIGKYNHTENVFIRENNHAIDYGLDFYAPQTLMTEDGRRVMIAWMQNWDNYLTPDYLKWSGMMTIPRELTLRDGRLIQNPVKEIARYYKNEISYINHKIRGKERLNSISGRIIDMTVEIKKMQCDIFRIFLAENQEYKTSVSFDTKRNILSFNRNYSGFTKDIVGDRKIVVRNQESKLKLRILLDKYSIEIFVNDGEQAMTSLIYTPQEADGIVFETENGTAVIDVTKFDIIVD